MTNNKKKLKKGFTLAELMLAILVISIIMVALAPVITKRVKENIPNDSNYDGKLFLYSAPGTECVAATDGQKAVDCIFTVPDGVDKISAVLVSGGGGGAGAARVEAASEVVTKTVTSSSSATAQTDSIVITDNMKDVRIKYMMGGGGGGSAGAYYEVTDTKLSREICDKYGALYVESKYNGTGWIGLIPSGRVKKNFLLRIPNPFKKVLSSIVLETRLLRRQHSSPAWWGLLSFLPCLQQQNKASQDTALLQPLGRALGGV